MKDSRDWHGILEGQEVMADVGKVEKKEKMFGWDEGYWKSYRASQAPGCQIVPLTSKASTLMWTGLLLGQDHKYEPQTYGFGNLGTMERTICSWK
jgi:hypothetical protein